MEVKVEEGDMVKMAKKVEPTEEEEIGEEEEEERESASPPRLSEINVGRKSLCNFIVSS